MLHRITSNADSTRQM
jgi:hypothetical protein